MSITARGTSIAGVSSRLRELGSITMSKLRNVLVAGASVAALIVLAGCPAETQSASAAKEPSASKGTTSGPSCDPKVGNKAPELTIESMNGAGKASIVAGKVTLVDFWASWCGPCKVSFPKYQELYTKYKAQGFEVIALSVDDEKTPVPNFIKVQGAKFPVGWDKGHTFADCWKPATMPSAYLIDKKGVVRQIHNKWEQGDEKELEAQIKALL